MYPPTDVTVASANIVNGTIVSADIADGTIVNADVNASAAIAGTKVSPDFGAPILLGLIHYPMKWDHRLKVFVLDDYWGIEWC